MTRTEEKSNAARVVRGLLDEFNEALRTKDLDIVERFHKDAIFIGSEPGEMARGRSAIATLFAGIFRSTTPVRFRWTSIDSVRRNDTVWFLADGAVILGDRQRPYSLSGVLAKGGKGWRWRLFHGSEPWIDAESRATNAPGDVPAETGATR